MTVKSLCWKCANCTSIETCEFVRNINKFYYTHKYKMIIKRKDLPNFYIKGTKADSKGNIIFCLKFVSDNLDHRTKKEKIEDLAKSLGYSRSNDLYKKIEILDKHFQKQMLQKEKEQTSYE